MASSLPMPNQNTARGISRDAILYMFHHVFLPANVPQEDDYNPEYEALLLDRVIESLCRFKERAPSQHADTLDSITTMITRLRTICESQGYVNERELGKALTQLDTEGTIFAWSSVLEVEC